MKLERRQVNVLQDLRNGVLLLSVGDVQMTAIQKNMDVSFEDIPAMLNYAFIYDTGMVECWITNEEILYELTTAFR